MMALPENFWCHHTIITMEIVEWKISIAIFLSSIYIPIRMQPKIDDFPSFFSSLFSRSVHWRFSFSKLILYLLNSLFFFFSCFSFWTVCQIDRGFLFGHRDRSETHPAYLPTFSVKLSFMRISIYSIHIYIFFLYTLCIMNGLLQCMYACCFIQDAGNIFTKKKEKEMKGCFIVVLLHCSHSFFFDFCFDVFFSSSSSVLLIVQRYCFLFFSSSSLDDNDEEKEQQKKRNKIYEIFFFWFFSSIKLIGKILWLYLKTKTKRLVFDQQKNIILCKWVIHPGLLFYILDF